jgi:hypothetical protein
MNRHARQRFKIVLAMVFCLLFQQAALAAYLCPLEQPAETSAMAEHCAEMGMGQAQDNPGLCQKLCAPDILVTADRTSPTVPALALAPPMHALDLQPISHITVLAEVPIAPSDPPARLRFCSLLI